MKLSSLLAVFTAFTVAPLRAQPEPPRPRPPAEPPAPPQINAEAKLLVDTMVGRYQTLPSYSDSVRVDVEGGANMPPDFRAGFPVAAHLAWSRPARLRFEGTVAGKPFLAVSDEARIHVWKPEQPGVFVERLQHPPVVATFPDGHKETLPPDNSPARLDSAQMESGAMALGTAFMTEPDFWTRTLEDVTVVALEADAQTGGEACRVVNVQASDPGGHLESIRLWIAQSDGLLRRMELSDAGMGAGSKIIETHFDVKPGAVLPDSTWQFEAPAGAKAVEFFPDLEPHKLDPTIKIGDLLPTFSGDGLDGAPIELNDKSGKVTILCFFTLGMGPMEVRGLQGLQNKLGADRVQIVGVAGDGRRERVEKFVADNKISIPIYVDNAGMNNRLANVFGVRRYTTTLVFGPDGKLAASLGSTRAMDFSDAIQKLFPGETLNSIVNAVNAELPAPQ